MGKKCLNKCCPPDKIISNFSCQNENMGDNVLNNKLKIYKREYCKNLLNISQCDYLIPDINYFHYIVWGYPKCESDVILLEEFYMLDNGSIIDIDPDNELFYEISSENYCVELNENNGTSTIISLVCSDASTSEIKEKHDMLITYNGLLISVIFLIITILVYALIPDLQNLHGKSLMSHCISLTIAYVFLAVLQMDDVYYRLPIEYCLIFPYIVILAFLSSFFWLNVMCFDIWWGLSGYKQLVSGSKKETEIKKFIYYSIYSWGLPILIFMKIFSVETWPSLYPDYYIKPDIGKTKCWFDTNAATLVYFYFPIMVTLCMNVLFFIMTSYRIWKVTKETKILKHGENKRHENERDRFGLYVKLFIVMGINWLAEVASFFFEDLEIWRVTDITNTLQGLLIFIIFVCKKRVFELIRRKFCSRIFPNNILTKSMSRKSSSNLNSSSNHTTLSNSESNVTRINSSTLSTEPKVIYTP